MNTTSLLAWWNFNNTDNDSDLLNASGLDDARSNFGHLLDNNGFDDGFYDPAAVTSGVTPQIAGVDALLPVSGGGDGALTDESDLEAGIAPDVAAYGAYLDVTALAGANFTNSTSNSWGSFGGTGLNRADGGTFSGGSLSVTGSGNNGGYFDIVADLSSYGAVAVSWAERGTSTGFDSRVVSVSTDGGTSFSEIYTSSGDLTSSWAVQTAEAGSLLDGVSEAIIRFTLDGATSASGNNRFDNIQLTGAPVGGPSMLVINEIDSDTAGTDTQEFVELFDGGVGNTALDGYVAVFFNGSDDASYRAIDLDGYATDANGFLVIGNEGVTGVDIVIPSNGLQNGADAVGLYLGDAADFPNDTPVTTENLVDAIVYDTNDGDDAGLLAGLGEAVQYNEGANGDKDGQSIARLTDGSYAAQAPTPGAPNTTTDPEEPEEPELVLISDIQGTPDEQIVNGFGDEGSSPLLGFDVTVQGVVTATFEDLGGFFVQEEASDSDGDIASSEGIFVYTPSGFSVAEGYQVTVTGTVGEFFGKTQIGNVASLEVLDAGNNLGLIDVPVLERADYGGNEDLTALEQFESMKVAFAQDFVVSEYFQLARFGQITLYEGERPVQFTQENEPDVQAYAAYLEDLATRRIILDDGNNAQNVATPDGEIFYPQPGGFSTGTQGVDFFRGGDVVTDLTGVLDWSFAGSGGTDAWRLRPTEADPVVFTPVNERPDTPEDVGGSLQVASFNVLNYFTTLDDGTATTATGLDPRGANSVQELERQTAKIVDALTTMDAHVYGLIEIENDAGEATQALVDALNAEAGADTYAFIDTGVIGTDAIKVALIYDQTKVRPVGEYAILDSAVDPRFDDQANRPALAQTFEEIATTGTFTAAVNHLKSKGSIANGDAAIGDGAGNNDQVRTDAAEALVDWLATDPTGSGDADVMILGDLNAYAMEDPIDAIKEGADGLAGTADDYVDLLSQATDGEGYSYLFDGQLGTLDYAMANGDLAGQVTGATAWNINADEVPLFDYNDDVRDPGEASFEEEPSGNALYEPNAFRASDHDPILVGLDLDPTFNLIAGRDGKTDILIGTSGRDLIDGKGGRLDLLYGGADADRFVFGAEADNGRRDRDIILDYEVGVDEIDLGGAAIASFKENRKLLKIELDGDGDTLFVKGVGSLGDITFVGEDFLFA